ncbi:MAG: zinc-dependent alcohol dehydrogenase family protein [Algiphilus sp.]|uniref:zinc-dependent alcohol dehydrogenase family protein n=1 Tax=Algiphilus sp. TaxID=1872431 RepID=UPI0032EF28BC
MRVMQLDHVGAPLRAVERTLPEPGPGQLLVQVHACGVCRTDLHVVDGDLPDLGRPVVPGHEIVGSVRAQGEGVQGHPLGSRVGIPWLGWSCGQCRWCQAGQENLCPEARFTGYQIDGGYADHVLVDARYCFALPAHYSDIEAAPLLCAGLIGYRALTMTGDACVLGIYGFGAAAHIVTQVALYQGRRVHAFTRPGDADAQAFARRLGVHWSGDSDQAPPEALEAAILFAPVGALVPEALRRVVPGGVVVCAGIHMSEIPAFPYAILWGERSLRSVANLTRADAEAFLSLAPQVPVRTHTVTYALEEANAALDDLRAGRLSGAAVLVPERTSACE